MYPERVFEFCEKTNADVYCLQEVKATSDQVIFSNSLKDNYTCIWNPACKAGYSGTLVLTRNTPSDFLVDFDGDEFSTEGRVITVDFGEFYLVTAYTPNSQKELARLPYRLRWEERFQRFITLLDTLKPVILCGDLNVAHTEIDIARPNSNHFSPGFSDEERQAFSNLLSKGFVDVWRERNKDVQNVYSFWSYLGQARERNIGWRLDYFVVSERLLPKVIDCSYLTHVQGSDHCPLMLDIDI